MEVTEISDGNLDNLQLKLIKFTTVIVGYHKSNVALFNYIWGAIKAGILSKNNV
jgi:hypothetical protein